MRSWLLDQSEVTRGGTQQKLPPKKQRLSRAPHSPTCNTHQPSLHTNSPSFLRHPSKHGDDHLLRSLPGRRPRHARHVSPAAPAVAQRLVSLLLLLSFVCCLLLPFGNISPHFVALPFFHAGFLVTSRGVGDVRRAGEEVVKQVPDTPCPPLPCPFPLTPL